MDKFLFFYLNYFHFVGVKLQCSPQPQFSLKLSTTYFHTMTLFENDHNCKPRFMLEIKNSLRTSYNDCYYKIVCNIELDYCIHLKIDVGDIRNHLIHKGNFCRRLVDICDSLAS